MSAGSRHADPERLHRLVAEGDEDAARALVTLARRAAHDDALAHAARLLLDHEASAHEAARTLIALRAPLSPSSLERCYRLLREGGDVRLTVTALQRLQPDDWWPYWRERFPNWSSAPTDPALRRVITHVAERGPLTRADLDRLIADGAERTFGVSSLIRSGWLLTSEGPRLELGPRVHRLLPLRPEHDARDLRTFIRDRFAHFGVMRTREEHERALRDVARSFSPRAAPLLVAALERERVQPSDPWYPGLLTSFTQRFQVLFPNAWRDATRDTDPATR